MGFNPFRKSKPTATDVVIVVVAIILILAVIVWTLLPS